MEEADNSIGSDLVSVCQILNHHKIGFMIVRGTAVGFYGCNRPAIESDSEPLGKADFDFWCNLRLHIYNKLLNALDELGIDTSRVREDDFPNPKRSFFKYKVDKFKVDFIPQVPGCLDFTECFKRRLTVAIQRVEMGISGFEDLIITKRATGRKKDLDDIEKSEEIRGETQG